MRFAKISEAVHSCQCRTGKRPAWDTLFKMLGDANPLSRNGFAGGNISGQREKEVAFAQRALLTKFKEKKELDTSWWSS